MKKLLLILLVVSTICFCGCGGGGDSAGGLSPEKQEYADVFLAFVSRVNENNKSSEEAMKLILPGLVYNKDKNGYHVFEKKLDNYLSKIDNPAMTVDDIGVLIKDTENKLADVRAYVSYKKDNSGEIASGYIQVQVDCNYTNSHGIVRFHGLDEEITAFPPEL